MFLQTKIIRCKKCKRPFSNHADHCPECHAKTPRGWLRIIVPVVCVVAAIVVLGLTIYFLANTPD